MSIPIKPRYIVRNLKVGFRRHGPMFPFVIVARLGQYLYVMAFGEKTFSFHGKHYRHFYHLENPTFRSERSVEVALALDVLKGTDPAEVLEVGNVLANYGSFQHTVLDKYEKDRGVINEDIVAYNPGRVFRRVICVSTLEHVGWDETPKEPEKLHAALDKLKTLVSPDGELLLTAPLGYNSTLDRAIADGSLRLSTFGFMLRDPGTKRWQEAQYEEVRNARYGHPHPNANAILVGWYRPGSR